MASSDIFGPVGTAPPSALIGSRDDHPVPRQGLVPSNPLIWTWIGLTRVQTPSDKPIPTNKFYANFFLGSQMQATWTHPYSLSWSKGSGVTQSWGMGVSHIDANQLVRTLLYRLELS